MKNFKIVAFGDSLTYGYGVLDSVSFTSRLKKDFPKFKIINKGINGDTSREAIARLEADVLSNKPQLVTVFFGSNDCSLIEDYYRPMVEFEKNMRRIMDSLVALEHGSSFNNGKCLPLLITPPAVVPTDFFPFTTNDRVEFYAEKIIQLAEEYNCPVIDLFKALYAKKEEAAFEDFFQFDGMHLSKQGYDLLYSLIFSELKKIIPENKTRT